MTHLAPVLSGQNMNERTLGTIQPCFLGRGQSGGGQAAQTEMGHGLEGGSWVAEGCGLQNRAATETGRKEGQVGVDAGRVSALCQQKC